jgi:MYXO-CTERM domain-containing protein
VLSLAGLATTQGAHAYTIANALSSGCHERITSDALRAVRKDLSTAHPLTPTDDEKALIGDLQFKPDADMSDLGGVTLLMGVRDNDLKGRGSGDLSQLAAVHGNPEGQAEHCLRAVDQLEPGGSEAAMRDCRAFIHQNIADALDALDAAGNVDASKRTLLPIHLELRGSIDASLPTFYVRMGQAIHAVEDSFTHTYRTPDGMKVTVVLNWVESVNGKLVESRDGPPHLAELDRCDDPDDRRRVRRELATEAATALLRSALDPSKPRASKLAEVDATLDKYLGYQAGCTFGNNWCDAPEAAYKPSGSCGCQVPSKTSGGTWLGLSALALGALAFTRRARRTRAAALGSVVAAALLTSGVARAQASEAAGAPAPEATPTPTKMAPAGTKPLVDDNGKPLTVAEKAAIEPEPTRPVAEPGSHDPGKTSFGFYGAVSGSIDKPAAAATLGFRVRPTPHWAFGLDGELNRWIGLNGSNSAGASVLNVYGTAILRFPLAYENFNLRSTANLGTSFLMTSLYGAPSGSIGIYFGISPLGIEWKASRSFYLIINPLNIAVPVPQLKGVPLLYPQYRFTIGLEFDTG